MKHNPKHETGQSIVIIAVLLVAFAALAAIVVDVGYSYVQDRKLQNATDAASLAGSLAVAQKQTYGGIADVIDDYMKKNVPDISSYTAYFVVVDAGGTTHILNGSGVPTIIPRYGISTAIPPTQMTYSGTLMNVVGVYVDANKQSNTFFAKAIGFNQVKVVGNAMGHVNAGVCSATNVFPAALNSAKAFPGGNISYEQIPPATEYTFTEDASDGHGGTVEGQIQYVTWGWSPSSGDTTAAGLVSNMNTTSRSGEVAVTTTTYPGLPGSAGQMSTSSAVVAAWQARVGGDPLTLPVFDTYTGSNATAVYHIVGFVSFRVTGVVAGGGTTPYKVKGYAQKWVDPQARGGCADFGIASVTENPPNPNVKRTLAGSVTFVPVIPDRPAVTTTVSADVVFVMDNSGSMNYAFGGGDSTLKITAAKSAMNSFLDKIQISNTVSGFNHQVGFVKFPQTASNQSFNDACEAAYADTHYVPKITYFQAVQDQVYSAMSSWRPLGTSIATVKSDINALSPANGTAMALGLIKGREIVLGAGRNPNNVPVIILATDGMPNVLSSDGKTTGWNGLLGSSTTNVKPLGTNPDGTTTYPNCNASAASETYAAANAAKNAGVLIFTIGTGATGSDFDPNVLKAIATPDGGGRTYFFTAGDSGALNTAYDSIAKTFTNLSCFSRELQPQRASGAVLTIKKPDGTFLPPVYTLANGEFLVSDVAPGRYEITAVSYTYHEPVTGSNLPYTTFTDGPGGAAAPNPFITVLDPADTYRTDTFIKTTASPCQ